MSDVPVIQLEVLQTDNPRRILVERATTPKFVPCTVIDTPEVVGPLFASMALVTGASYEKIFLAVRMTVAIVMDISRLAPLPDLVRQTSCVLLVQVVVPQAVASILTVALTSEVAKFRPRMLNLLDPEVGVLKPFLFVIRGMS